MPFARFSRRALVISSAILLCACTPVSQWPDIQRLNECAATRFFITHYPKDAGIPDETAELARCGDLRKSDGMSFTYQRISEDVHEYSYGITGLLNRELGAWPAMFAKPC